MRKLGQLLFSYEIKEDYGSCKVLIRTSVIIENLKTSGCTEEEGECSDIGVPHHCSTTIIWWLLIVSTCQSYNAAVEDGKTNE